MAERARKPRTWLTMMAATAMVVGGMTVTHGRGDGDAQETKPDKKRESGIYVESAETSGKDELKQLEGAMPQIEAQGMGASMATMGFKKPKMLTKVSGDKSAVRVGPQSTFLFVFGSQKSQREMMENPMGSMSGLPAITSSPKDYALVVLAPVEGDRVYNSSGGKQIKCAVEKLEPKVFRIKPETALEPGEYAFTWMQNGAASMMWDFGVDGATK